MNRIKNSLIALGGLSLLIGAIAIITPHPTQGQGGDSAVPTRPVKVVNTTAEPVPITGTVTSADVTLKKPSDSVLATTFMDHPCHTGQGYVMNVRIRSNGSLEPFSIPAGFAFMLTGVDFVTNDVSAGGRAGFVLTTVDGGFAIAGGFAINDGATGPVSGSTILSTPMRVTSNLCINRSVGETSGGTRTHVRGFLVNDN